MVDNRNLSTIQNRLAELAKLPKMKENSSIMEVLSEHGFTRRDFMKWGLTHIAHAPETIQPGDFVQVRITGARGYDLTAKLI